MQRKTTLWRFAPLLLLPALSVHAQDLRHAAPPTVPPMQPPATTATPMPLFDVPHAGAGEHIILPALKGIVLLPDADASALRRTAVGVDAAAVPLVNNPAIVGYLQPLIGQPASLASLNLISVGISRILREQGKPFVLAWLPPQDLTDGTVRIVVRPAVVDGAVSVVGAENFSEESYLAWVRQQPGQTVDVQALQEDLAWINHHPFRHAALAAEPGAQPGSVNLSLRVREQAPWRWFVGAENTGTKTTDENRVFWGVNWGNAFGRGDQVSYQLRADPRFQRSMTHSGSYQTDLSWRHVLTLNAAWSQTEPDLGPHFNQKGTSWQLGLRYQVPNAWRHGSWEGDFIAGLDYKFADNNLEFAAIPVSGNETRIVQAVLGASLHQSRGKQGSTVMNLNLLLSPGGSADANNDQAFDVSRSGAPARYAYAKLDAQHSQSLGGDWRWDANASVQLANVPLLGSEQMAAGGVGVLRGFPESTAFGDRGVTLSNELHLPSLQSSSGQQADLYLFMDGAYLQTCGGSAESISLSSAGVGADVQWGRSVTLRMAIGWPLHETAGRDLSRPKGHLRLQWNF